MFLSWIEFCLLSNWNSCSRGLILYGLESLGGRKPCKSLVMSHLEYCVSTTVWSPHYVKDRERLERVQHRIPRMLPGLKGFEYGRRPEKLRTLDERRNRSNLIKLFKISKGLSAIPWNLLFVLLCGQFRKNKRPFKEADQGWTSESSFFKKGFEQMEVCRWSGDTATTEKGPSIKYVTLFLPPLPLSQTVTNLGPPPESMSHFWTKS